jgi:ketosteroid isomerase-like protein
MLLSRSEQRLAGKIVVLALLLAPFVLHSQDRSNAEAEIRALIARLDSAATRDPSLVQHLFTDEFYTVHGNGSIHTKAEWLALRARLRIHSTEWSEMKFFSYGDVVIVSGVVRRLYDLPDGRPVDERRRTTHVWVHRKGQWQVAAMHGTRIP